MKEGILLTVTLFRKRKDKENRMREFQSFRERTLSVQDKDRSLFIF
jgi:hypothetical protein